MALDTPANLGSFPARSYVQEAVEYAQAVQRLEGLLEKFLGKRPKAAPDKAWEAFLSLPLPKKEEILRGWNAQSDFLQAAIGEGIRCGEETRMLQLAMSTLNLMGNSDLFELVEDSDVMEIIGPDMVQTYRSFGYFALCNYSLVELAAYPFFELYDRPSWVMDQIMKHGLPVLEGKTNLALLDEIPNYTIRELMTDSPCIYTMRERAYVRLVSSLNGKSYVLSLKKVTPLASPASENLAFI